MTFSTSDRIYNLLPTHYRSDDRHQGQPLRALLAIIETELNALEGNLVALYDNWFIETCEDWVVPYIADLLGVSGLDDVKSNIVTQRARVANTLNYRRRKGITFTIENAIQEMTNWYARVVACSELLSFEQNVKHVLPRRGRTLDLREGLALSELGGPFDSIAHSIDVRRISGGDRASQQIRRGIYNLSNVAIFIWRLRSYPAAYTVRDLSQAHNAGPIAAAYTFDPLGNDTTLFNLPEPRSELNEPMGKRNLPIPLTIALLAADLNAFQKDYPDPATAPANSAFYGPQRGLSIVKDDIRIHPSAVISRSLDWRAQGWVVPDLGEAQVAIDVERGHMLFAEAPLRSLAISYNYGFSGDFAGGPYDRIDTLAIPGQSDWRFTVSSSGDSLEAAIRSWNEQLEQPHPIPTGIIEIVDSDCYTLPANTRIVLPANGWLVIQAANTCCPSIAGSVIAEGRTTPLSSDDSRSLTLNGLRIDGQVILHHDLTLNLIHSTLVPRPARNSVAWENEQAATEDPIDLRVRIDRSIVGPLRLPATAEDLAIRDSIVDASQSDFQPAIASADLTPQALNPPYGPPITLEGVTVLGARAARPSEPGACGNAQSVLGGDIAVYVSECRQARDCIFDGLVSVQRQQIGSMSFSYVPPGSATPRRLNCQPDLALGDDSDAVNRALVIARIKPLFVSTRYGEASYAQLSQHCPSEISRGSQDGSEMGMFCVLNPTKREGNLSAALREYLVAGLEPGTFYIT
jgi:hypothetical protein